MPVRSLTARLVVAALLAGGSLVAAGTRHSGQEHYLRTQRYEDVYYLPPPGWLKALSLGYREAVADLIWLRSLVYFGEELAHRGEVDNLYNYADAMLALDPYFRRVYQWVATCALYRTGSVGVPDARRAIGYLERGVKLFPDDGELAWTLGANYLYELIPMLESKADQEEARRRGVEHIIAASRSGAGPPWLALSASTVLGKLGQHDRQLAHLEEVFAQVSDPVVKAQVETRIVELRDASYLEALRRTYHDLEAARLRDFPYLDRDLYLLVGPRPPFDGRAFLLRNFDPLADVMTESDL